MLLGKASPDDYNLYPSYYPWAYDLYNQAVRNTWFPHEIALKEDLDDWAKMTEDERHAVEFLIAFFNPAELIVNRSIALGIYPYLKSAECHLYLAKQMWEEANHCVAFEYVLQTFPLDREKDFVRNLVATNIVMEGIWFYSGFMVALSFRQRNQLRNVGSLVTWVLRDE